MNNYKYACLKMFTSDVSIRNFYNLIFVRSILITDFEILSITNLESFFKF